MERLNHVFIWINIHDTKEFPKELKEVFQNLGFAFDGNLADGMLQIGRAKNLWKFKTKYDSKAE